MTVHPQIGAFLATLPPGDGSTPDVAGWRAEGESHVLPLAERIPVRSVTDMSAETPTGDVPVRVYNATDAATAGVIVYFHGGAFFSGSLETHDHIARSLANASGFRVVSVGYRLAPESAFPAGLTDCFEVVKWVDAHAAQLGWNGTQLALVGDSSGGTFVAAVTALAHEAGFDKITHQVLLYPSVDLDFDESRYPSLRENAVGFGLETAALRPHNSFYLASGADPADPLVSPIKRADLTGLPPALVITAECDPLRDEGEAYADRLREAGVPVTLQRYEGATHGFVQYFGWLPEYAGVFARVADFIRS